MAEPPSPPRNEHQRDRDRIVHSTAFRRLIYKTQVFINHEGDLFRTRLTHSLEVAQLARSAARALRLNEDLVEAIALAHDLGHTPFGHAGQDALAACMADHGGFEHNLQSLRVVDCLEVRYPAFDGLNLSFETREGILKHCSQRDARQLLAHEPDGPALRFVQRTQPSLEAQLVNLADAVAYNAHDIDDGLRSGLLDLSQLMAVPLFARWHAAVLTQHPTLASDAADGQSGKRLVFEVLRRMLSEQVGALVRHTSAAIGHHAPRDAAAVRALPPLVSFGAELEAEMAALKSFLFGALYRHPRVEAMTALARTVVSDLYAAYRSDPKALPASAALGTETNDSDGDSARPIADYIAGMTDRFALREHHRLTGRRLFDE